MISYLGSLDQFSPAAGRAGRCRQMSLCVGGTRRALARQPAVLAPSPRVLRAFLSVASGLGSQRFAGALPGRGVPSPSAACAGFSLLHGLFSSCGEQGQLCSCRAQLLIEVAFPVAERRP